jgi:UPF0716 protein FxsA
MPGLLLLIIWPIAELFVAIKIAQAIGVLLTVVLLIAGWPVGLWLMKAEGRLAWQRLGAAVAQGVRPGREVLDGALVVLGGLLLIIPGFITDALGLSLLLAPTRGLTRRAIAHNFQSRFVRTATRFSRPGASAYDVDSTATDIPGSRLHR